MKLFLYQNLWLFFTSSFFSPDMLSASYRLVVPYPSCSFSPSTNLTFRSFRNSVFAHIPHPRLPIFNFHHAVNKQHVDFGETGISDVQGSGSWLFGGSCEQCEQCVCVQTDRGGTDSYRHADVLVTIHTAGLTFSNSTFCSHSVFMCFVWI